MSEPFGAGAPGQTKIKICGITCEEDALAAIRAGADAIGFITFRQSRRYVDLAAARDWIAALPPSVCRVAVLVNEPIGVALCRSALRCIDVLQLHGDEPADYCEALLGGGVRCIKALAANRPDMIERAAACPGCAILLDSAVPGAFGGTGRTFDWAIASRVREALPERPLILSGGLHPGNVAAAVAAVRPYAVDVASGVESSPGRKDAGKMERFVAAVRAATIL